MNKIYCVLLVAALFSACATGNAVQEERITIGAIHTLTGDLAPILGGSTHGVRMAVDDFQKETGITVRLIEEDDGSCSDKVSGATKLVHVDNVRAIVGTTCSSMTLGVAPVTEQSKVLLVSGVSTSASITDAGEYIFRTIPSDATKSLKVADEIKQNGYERVALLYANDNDAIVTGIEGVKDNLGDGIVVVEEVAVTDQERDFRSSWLKIMDEFPDVIVMSFSDSRQFGLAMKQLDELGLERLPVYVPIETIENPLTLEVGGQSVEGLMYPYFQEPSGPSYQSFREKYKQTYGQEVPAYAAEAYDATMITLKALARGSRSADRQNMFLVGTAYEGVSGTITFDTSGDVQKPLVMKTIRNGAFVKA